MKMKVLSQVAMLLLLSAGIVQAGSRGPGGPEQQNATCDDCSAECLKNPYGKGCPSICKDPSCQASCDDCSPECKKNPSGEGCPDICRDLKCQSCEDCTDECRQNPDQKNCPDICKDLKCYTCNDCSVDCLLNPDGKGCLPACKDLGCDICEKFPKDCPATCKDNPDDPEKCPATCKGVPEKCLLAKKVTCADCPPECEDNPEKCPAECKELNCHPKDASLLRFVGDLGYFRQSDPADYVFGRIGVEYRPFEDNGLENVSFLAMLGGAIQAGGTDGDDALLLDVIAQYNWSGLLNGGFIGLGVGGWITSGDVDDDSGDTDVDLIANIGTRVYGEPEDFNVSVFLEARSAIDEFDGLAEYGRFGAGLRCQF